MSLATSCRYVLSGRARISPKYIISQFPKEILCPRGIKINYLKLECKMQTRSLGETSFSWPDEGVMMSLKWRHSQHPPLDVTVQSFGLKHSFLHTHAICITHALNTPSHTHTNTPTHTNTHTDTFVVLAPQTFRMEQMMFGRARHCLASKFSSSAHEHFHFI